MTQTVELKAPDLLLVRYGELALKGGNRKMFENRLVENIHAACKDVSPIKVRRLQGRMLVFPERRMERVKERVSEVFGIKSVSPGWSVKTNLEGVVELAQAVVSQALQRRPADEVTTFRVSTRRAEKSFPMNSPQFDRHLAEQILPTHHPRLRVKLRGAELDLGVDIRPEFSFVFLERLPGPGGLPVGTQGRAVCLLSGGIDSPVAAWMAMKRGCLVSFATFHSHPYIGDASKKKVHDLARVLARYQPTTRLWVTPFTEIQTTIRDVAPEGYRTILYRRMMQRISSRLAESWKASALITGECLGQVASQTLENMSCIAAAADLPVLRPLIAFDKEETIRIAERIGTFPISNQPQPDCCTVFQPKKPIIRGRIHICESIESEMDVDGLIEKALSDVEVVQVER